MFVTFFDKQAYIKLNENQSSVSQATTSGRMDRWIDTAKQLVTLHNFLLTRLK